MFPKVSKLSTITWDSERQYERNYSCQFVHGFQSVEFA